MKKCVLLVLVCLAGGAFATGAFAATYNMTSDWVQFPDDPVNWDFGTKVETDWNSDVFGPFIPGEHIHDFDWLDRYMVPDTANSCWIGMSSIDIWIELDKVTASPWDAHTATARFSGAVEGPYDISANFKGAEAGEGNGERKVMIQVNGTTIFSQPLVGSGTVVIASGLPPVYLTPGDIVDFMVAHTSAGGGATIMDGTLTPFTTLLAWDPSPEDGATDVDLDTDLCWASPTDDPCGDEFSYNVYYGTDENNQAGPFLVSGAEPHCYSPLSPLTPDVPYFWHVDVLVPGGPIRPDPNNWTFTTQLEYTKAELLSPSPSGTPGVALDATLQWNAGDNAEWHNVYFGTDEILVTDRDVSVRVEPQTTNTSYDPFGVALMDVDTPYYWVVDEGVGEIVVAPGDLWNFTTEPLVCLPPVSALDQNGDCVVDLTEFAAVAGTWLECGYNNPTYCP